MDIRKYGEKLPEFLKKYKYAFLVLAIGLVLMALPSQKVQTTGESPSVAVSPQQADPAQELESILGKIQGVGKVQVLLTVKVGASTVYQTDEDSTASEVTSTVRKETVIITDAQKNQQPLIVKILSPEYMGAVIVCQGAENASVRLAVVDAVCKATGLGADKVSVLKMKG